MNDCRPIETGVQCCGHCLRGEMRHSVASQVAWLLLGLCGVLIGCEARGERSRDDVLLNMKDTYLGLTAECDLASSGPGKALLGTDEVGLYSWRLPLLARLYPDSVVTKFQRGVPWHDERHRAIRQLPTSQIFGYHTCRAAKIVAVVGEDTAFDDTRHLKDAAPDTILLVEWRASEQLWFEPGDLSVTRIESNSGKVARELLGKGSFFVCFADGSVWELSDLTPVAQLALLCHADDGSKEDRRSSLSDYRIR
jgi:hypothetical protein